MDTKYLFLEALKSATSAIMLVKPSDYAKPTPDTEWNVLDLAKHMLYELSWLPDILAGSTINEVGDRYEGDLIGNDLLTSWRSAEKLAIKAVNKCDLNKVAHLSWMDATNDFYLKQAASDQLIHSWDLSKALNQPVRFNKDIAQYVLDISQLNLDGMMASGLFAKPIEVNVLSDLQTKLLALYGRDINWRT